MNDLSTSNKESFWKKMAVIVGAGIVLIAGVYFGKTYNESQKKAEITEFYNQFSDQNYIDFAKMIETAIHEERPDDIDKNVDIASFFDFSNKELTGSFNKRKTIELLKPRFKIGDFIDSHLFNTDDFIFTKFYKKDGIPHIVFRLYRSDIVNFLDFTLGIKKDKIIIKDMYNYLAGILFSEMASYMYYTMLNERDFSALNLKTYQQVQEKIGSGNYEEAYQLLVSIPVAKRGPYHYQLSLIVATNFDDDELLKVIAETKAVKSNDERLQKYLNFHEKTILGDLATLNIAIDDFKKYVGEDPIFDVYRGIMFNYQEEYEQAALYFDRVITEMPDFYDGYFYKLYILLKQDKAAAALNLITKMKKDFLVTEEDITFSIQEFEEFTNSEAYKNIFKDAE